MGAEGREVEDVPGLTELENEPLSSGGAQDELRPPPAEDVPPQGRGALAKDHILGVETAVVNDPIQNFGLDMPALEGV